MAVAAKGTGVVCRAPFPIVLSVRRSAAFSGPSCSRQQTWSQPAPHSQQRLRQAPVQAMAAAGGEQPKTKVLMVCLGNICRSPTAEAVFQAVVEREGVAVQFEIDSCGTGGGSSNWYQAGGFSYHKGDAADGRMTKVAAARGVKLTSRSRPLQPSDLTEFDFIIGMDAKNVEAIKRAAEYWKGQHAVPEDYASKVRLMTQYLQDPKWERYEEVPDPYYGGQAGFELVLDLLEDASEGLLKGVRSGSA